MNKISLSRAESMISPDIGDELEIFLYTNLSALVSSNPDVVLTPSFQAALTSALNSIDGRHNITTLPSDLTNILEVFIIMNASRIV
ncbi:hypothetical protein Salpa_2013 [Sporomusa sp. KB1]|jgi:hypothetical protein|nr:hypothetical protein Salpa_2013 [Sporomusa sp. KB1]